MGWDIKVYYFIVNKNGGGGRGKRTWGKIKKILDKKNVEYKVLFTGEDGTGVSIAKNISSLDGEKNIIVVGGDGTINEVINGFGSFENLKLGIIPTGSGNDFARGIGISKNVKKSLNRILNSTSTKKIDLGKIKFDDGKSRIFGISCGIGLDAIVCKKVIKSKIKNFLNKIGLGQAIYVLYTIQTLFSMNTEKLKISFDGGEYKVFEKTIFASFMNFEAEGGGVKMYAGAKCDDGKASVCIAHGIKKIKTFFILPFLVAGKHKKFDGFEFIECRKAELVFDYPQVVHLDGEYGGAVDHFVMEVVASKLNVLQ